jgi:transitional endoplasmic reticulum ATPase
MSARAEVRLQVGRARPADMGRGTARVARRAFDELEIEAGDVVEVTGSYLSGVRALPPHPEDEVIDLIRLDGLQRANVGAAIGEYVVLRKCHPPEARVVDVAPLAQRGTAFDERDLTPALLLGRPLAAGDVISVVAERSRGTRRRTRGPSPAPLGERRFVVLETEPPGVVVVGEATRIRVDHQPREETRSVPSLEQLRPPRAVGITYDDVGGMDAAIAQIRELVELPLKHPELFRGLGIEPPRGVLLHGPPGTGKTRLARAVANEAGVAFLHIAGPEIMGSLYGESEERLRTTFSEAQSKKPAIIFIDEIDSIAASRERARGDVERRVVAQLLTLMDGLDSPEGLMVLAATNRVDDLDEALRRPGRFDREIAVGAPDAKGRRQILGIHTRGIPLDDVDLDDIARTTHGFVGADLASLVREAVMEALRRCVGGLDPGDADAVSRVVGTISVEAGDFRRARARVSPSALREIHVEVAQANWDDVGGLDAVKERLREAIEWPLRRPEAFRRLGIRPPSGILLFGPPGTGKTLLARVVAAQAEANFILVRASSLLSRWYGESERQVSRIFARARRVAPAVLFIDEIDALAPQRAEVAGGEPLVTERVVNTLLAEMDGVEVGEGVVVVGATNRPMRLDPALLRPGRFDELLYVPVPDRDARLHILGVHSRAMPLAGDVDLAGLADRTGGFTGADLEDLVRRAGIAALRRGSAADRVEAHDFELAMGETRASVTPEVAREYEEVSRTLKQSSVRVRERIGFQPDAGRAG